MQRSAFTRIIAAATLLALAATTACTGDGDDSDGRSLEKITYLTSAGTFGRDAYAYVAKEKGYFADAGFDVDIKPGVGTAGNIKAVVGGQAHFAPVDLTAALLAAGKAQGRPLGFTAVAGVQQRTMAAILTLEGSGITTPKDLEGKTLADAPGSVVRSLFEAYATLAKVDRSRVKWVNGATDSLTGGKVAGIGQFVVNKPTTESLAEGRKALLLPYSDYLQDLYGNALITSSSYARAHPDKVRRFTAALLRGLEEAIADGPMAGQILKKYVPATDPDTAVAEVRLMAAYVRAESSGVPVGALDNQRVARGIAVLQGAGAVPAGLAADQVIDFGLVPTA